MRQHPTWHHGGVPQLIDPVVPPGTLAAMPQPTLSAAVYELRPWRAEDSASLVFAYDDPGIQRWHARTMTADEAREWIAARSDRWNAETGADWAVVDGREVVGRVGLRALELSFGLAEAAYWVMPSARGRGVAGAALTAMTDWLFTDVGLHRIDVLHSTRNRGSCRVAEKAGYPYEATLHSQLLHDDGWHDMHLHARINVGEDRRPVV
jgi:RimJ/RimL family protein N-acetyltransferase